MTYIYIATFLTSGEISYTNRRNMFMELLQEMKTCVDPHAKVPVTNTCQI